MRKPPISSNSSLPNTVRPNAPLEFKSPNEIGLYVHFPWCVRKCPYCDFNSHEIGRALPRDEYLQCLRKDLGKELSRTTAAVKTVYCGGGTPSLFDPAAFTSILAHERLSDVAEITMEMNPGAAEYQALTDYRAAGITRLSIGVQSLHDESLHQLGRIHSSQEAREAIYAAQQAGFESINLDLMFGLPDQTIDMAMQDLDALIALEPEHISWYQLTIEPNTVFANRPPSLASDDERADMSDAGLERLAAAGYRQYEVSAFARDDGQFECRHNLNYWQFGDYIGIGAGAHGKISQCSRTIIRTQKTRVPKDYASNIEAIEVLIPQEELPVEFLMNALRLNRGTESARFTQTTGFSLDVLQPTLAELRHQSFIDSERLALTELGRDHLNSIVAKFLT